MDEDDRVPDYREDLAWAGGLFEGEGCISTTSLAGGRPAHCMGIRVQLEMGDLDVVERFHRIVGVGTLRGPRWRKGYKRPLHVWSTYNFEHAQAVIAMLWPWLGERRRGRAVELLRGIRTARAGTRFAYPADSPKVALW